MAWYNVGTITATNNSATITGVSTAFLSNVRVGDGVTIAGSTSIHEVTNITSETQLTIAPVYAGTTGSGKAYSIVPVQGYTKTLADQAKALLLTYSGIAGSASVNALSGTTGTANTMPYFTSGSAMSTTPVTAAARTLLDDADVATMRTTLGLKTGAVTDVIGTMAGGAIIESGSNAAGAWTKFASGLAIVKAAVFNMVVTAGGIHIALVNLPIDFVGDYQVLATGVPTVSNVHYGWPSCYANTPYQAGIVHFNGPSAQTMVTRVTCIGFWKAV